jgi:hypothetical protein
VRSIIEWEVEINLAEGVFYVLILTAQDGMDGSDLMKIKMFS